LRVCIFSSLSHVLPINLFLDHLPGSLPITQFPSPAPQDGVWQRLLFLILYKTFLQPAGGDCAARRDFSLSSLHSFSPLPFFVVSHPLGQGHVVFACENHPLLFPFCLVGFSTLLVFFQALFFVFPISLLLLMLLCLYCFVFTASLRCCVHSFAVSSFLPPHVRDYLAGCSGVPVVPCSPLLPPP